MFLHALDADEATAFARAAMALVHVDDHVDEREVALLEEMQAELGMTVAPEVVTRESALEGLARSPSPTVARIMLLELVGVATADEVDHPEELSFLQEAAVALGLDPALLDDYLDFASRAQGVWKEGRALVLDE